MAVRSQLRDLAATVLSRPRRTGGEVRISTATRDRIVGRLTLGTSGLEFDSSVVGVGRPRASIRSLENRRLIDVEADQTAITVRLAGGAVVSRAAPAQIEPFTATPAERAAAAARPAAAGGAARPATAAGAPVARPAPEAEDATVTRRAGSARGRPASPNWIQGDRRAVDAFFREREFALLPELSYALGLAGATGVRYRPSLVLHSMGLSAGRILGIDPARPGVTYRYRLPPFIRVADPRAFFDRLAPTDCWNPWSGQPNYEGLPTCEGPDPGCEAYPNQDRDCFGMCGPGCTICWDWVCGDCCYHDFCAEHDALLRSCDGVADVALCLASILVLPTRLLGCDHDWLPW
jgi:hypothetical protein